jgi:hypothetical protein
MLAAGGFWAHLRRQRVDEVFERLLLSLRDKVELAGKQNEVLQARVEVCLENREEATELSVRVRHTLEGRSKDSTRVVPRGGGAVVYQ